MAQGAPSSLCSCSEALNAKWRRGTAPIGGRELGRGIEPMGGREPRLEFIRDLLDALAKMAMPKPPVPILPLPHTDTNHVIALYTLSFSFLRDGPTPRFSPSTGWMAPGAAWSSLWEGGKVSIYV